MTLIRHFELYGKGIMSSWVIVTGVYDYDCASLHHLVVQDQQWQLPSLPCQPGGTCNYRIELGGA